MANELAISKQKVLENVEKRIAQFQSDGMIHFPDNYSPQNALKSAWLILQETTDKNHKPVLSVCSQESIANALLNTVIQGLSPAKKQVYYIAHGATLTAMRSYHGTKAVTLRLKGVESVSAEVIYEGDVFEISIQYAAKKVTQHKREFSNIDDSKIIGAYCTIMHDGGREYTEVMTKAQIEKSWLKRSNSGSVQKEFPAEMAMRTVINRACKRFVNASDDSDLMIYAFNQTGEAPSVESTVQQEISENANREVLDFTPNFEVETDNHSAIEPETDEPLKTSPKEAGSKEQYDLGF